MAEISEGMKEMFLNATRTIMNGEPLKMAKGISDEQLNAVYSLAYSYYTTGKYDEALKLFKFLVLFDHLSQKYWTGLGSTHQMMKSYDEAIAAYAQAALLDLSNPKPMYYAALCYLAKGDKLHSASAVRAVEIFCTEKNPKTQKYLEKTAALRQALGEDTFAELKKVSDEAEAKNSAVGA